MDECKYSMMKNGVLVEDEVLTILKQIYIK